MHRFEQATNGPAPKAGPPGGCFECGGPHCEPLSVTHSRPKGPTLPPNGGEWCRRWGRRGRRWPRLWPIRQGDGWGVWLECCKQAIVRQPGMTWLYLCASSARNATWGPLLFRQLFLLPPSVHKKTLMWRHQNDDALEERLQCRYYLLQPKRMVVTFSYVASWIRYYKPSQCTAVGSRWLQGRLLQEHMDGHSARRRYHSFQKGHRYITEPSPEGCLCIHIHYICNCRLSLCTHSM